MRVNAKNKFLVIAFMALYPSVALAGNGALGMAHKLGFYGCGNTISESQKMMDGWINEGKGGNWYTKVQALGKGKYVNGIVIEDYTGNISQISEITKTGPNDTCQYSIFSTIIFSHHTCQSVMQMVNSTAVSNAGHAYIIGRTVGGSLVSYRPINDGSGCIQQVTVVNAVGPT